MNGQREDKFVEVAKRLLDESVADLDGATLSRLARARNRALERRTGWGRLWRPLPMAGLGAAMAAAVLVLFVTLRPGGELDTTLVADLELVTAEESVEFFEDMEFYEWLAAEDGPLVSDRGPCVPMPDRAGPDICPAAAGELGAGDGIARISWII